jgi:hypothetical protein
VTVAIGYSLTEFRYFPIKGGFVNALLIIALFGSVDLYFLENSPDLLVRIVPQMESENVTLYYSFSGTQWDSIPLEQRGRFVDVTLPTPANVSVIGLYARYASGLIDDDNGEPYTYEVKLSPRMLMPFSLVDLEVMTELARKKIMSNIHVDEAITVLTYVRGMLDVVPVIAGSPAESKRDLLGIEVNKLENLLRR